MPKSPIKPIAQRKIFISYSHSDYAHALNLHKELAQICRRLGDTAIFLDCEGNSQIMAGDPWRDKIKQALEEADVFIVLMSSDFIASEFCREIELRCMLERTTKEPHVLVIGVAIHQINLKNFWVNVGNQSVSLAERQCIPQELNDTPTGSHYGLRPISLWPESLKRDAWTRVAEQIEYKLLNSDRPLYSLPEQSESGSSTPTASNPATNWLPYLCDRDEQYYALLSQLAEWQTTDFCRPLVLLTEGRSQDCLMEWVKRMRQQEIAKCLGFEEMDLAFGHFKPISWPSATAKLATLDGARQRFILALATALDLPSIAKVPDKLKGAFNVHVERAHPTLLWTDCLDNTAHDHAGLALQGLLSVIGSSPPLNQRTMLVVAINLVREADAPADGSARLAQLFESMITQAVAQGQVQGALLGSLPELNETVINNWLGHDAIQGKLKVDSEKLFKSLPSGRSTWPMRVFAEEAKQWI
jgi:hypothetical protein